MRRLIILLAAVAAFAPRTARAGSVMQIDGGTSYLFGTDVHPISTATITISEPAASTKPVLLNPLLLIMGIPNATGYLAPALTLSIGTADPGGPGTGANTAYGATFDGSSGLAAPNGGVFNAGDVYSFLGLTGGNTSNSFASWTAADLAVNHLSVSSYGVFVYELTNTGMTTGGTITATFNGGLPIGTFVVAYDRDGAGHVYDTLFAESGVATAGTPAVTAVPEPGSLVLLASGLAGVAGRLRRRFLTK